MQALLVEDDEITNLPPVHLMQQPAHKFTSLPGGLGLTMIAEQTEAEIPLAGVRESGVDRGCLSGHPRQQTCRQDEIPPIFGNHHTQLSPVSLQSAP